MKSTVLYIVDLNKNNNPNRHKWKGMKFLFYTFLFFLSFGVFFLIDYFFFGGANLLSKSHLVRIVSSGSGIVNKFVDLELKNKDGITSVLIAGIDTRNIVFENGEFRSTKPQGQAGTRNIDTIIQVVYDHNKNEIAMISIPRDLGVDFNESCLKFSGSIHWIYDKTENANCSGRGVEELKQVVASVTGIPVNYHVFVTLDSFVDAIETVGEIDPVTGKKGIYVDNPTDVWDVYPYNDHGWENVYFKKGRIFLSGEDALKYVRVRQLTTDFGRARRQQIVIESVIGRVLSSETLLNPDKIAELYKIYRQKTLVSEISIKEIIAGLNLVEKANLSEMIHIVLDPTIAGDEKYLNKQPHNRPGGPYYMVPTHWKECPGNEFCRVQGLIQSIMLYPLVFKEEASIFAYATSNSKGKLYFEDTVFSQFEKSEPPINLTRSKFLVTTSSEIKDMKQVVVIDFSNGKYPKTLEYLSSQPNFVVLEGKDYQKYRLNKEDFSILVPPALP